MRKFREDLNSRVFNFANFLQSRKKNNAKLSTDKVTFLCPFWVRFVQFVIDNFQSLPSFDSLNMASPILRTMWSMEGKD